MEVADSGDYMAVQEMYSIAINRNQTVDGLFNFANDLGIHK